MPSPLKKGSPDGTSTKDKSPLLRESTKSPEGQEDKGQDNPVFDMDREEMQSRLGDISSVPSAERRRGSALLTLPSSSLLSVPKPGKNYYSNVIYVHCNDAVLTISDEQLCALLLVFDNAL